ncbi:ComEA family DNA-binding protein [Microbulbifer sp. 2201CG32-9]|uniref:ComEA family DNA-binding protein n=1 Tax=Microbulbifer sp. 2201CG32-9 TaxID=3232309 RepID=UPI00345C01AD
MNLFNKSVPFYLAILILALACGLSQAQETAGEAAEVAAVTVNLNTATAEELAQKLDGVGQTRAEMIVKYRETNGPFTTLEQLLEVKGVGVATLEKNRSRILL